MIPESIRHDTLSVREKEYFMHYNNLLTEYNNEIGLDLTADLEVIATSLARIITIYYVIESSWVIFQILSHRRTCSLK